MTKQRKILRLLDKGKTVAEISKQLNVPASSVYTTRWLAKKKITAKGAKKKRPSKLLRALQKTKAAMDLLENKNDFVEIKDEDYPLQDNVANPAHYKVGGIETWDFIEAKKLNYNLGSVIKYVSRAEYKGDYIGDLMKAREFLSREIKRAEDGGIIW